MFPDFRQQIEKPSFKRQALVHHANIVEVVSPTQLQWLIRECNYYNQNLKVKRVQNDKKEIVLSDIAIDLC